MFQIRSAKPSLTQTRLNEFEAQHAISFPTGYRDFLLAHNGGVPDASEFTYSDDDGAYKDGKVLCFLAVHHGRHANLGDRFRQYKLDERRLPDRIVPIADDEYGNLICISVSGADRGAVYYWDHENEMDATPASPNGEPTDANLYRLGDDFDQFLSRLRPPDGRPKEEPELVIDAGDLDRLRSMLDAGLPVDWANADGIPLIGIAAAHDDVAMVRLLLERGGDRQSAWNCSCGFGCNGVLKLLVPLGFDWPHLAFLLTVPQTWDDVELVRLVFENGGDINGIVDSMGKRPLHRAVNDPIAVRELLQLGAKPNLADKWGFTPLHGAAGTGDPVVMKLLIDAGADPYATTTADGKPPIKWIKDKSLRQEIADYAAARGFRAPVKQKASTPKQKRPPE